MIKLKTAREERNLTQEELAKMLNVTVQTLSRWENGHFEPKVSEIKKISEIFNCTLDDLLSANPTPPPRRTRGRPKGAATRIAAGII